MSTISSLLENISNNVAKIAQEVSKSLDISPFGTFSKEISDIKTDIGIIKDGSLPHPKLRGKKFGMMGDSLVRGGYENQYWPNEHYCWEMVAERNNMQYFSYGIGANPVSYYSGDLRAMCFRWNEMREDLDYIGFQLGSTDATRNVPIGEKSKDNTDNLTYCGALNIICEGLIKKYVGKKIFFCTNWRYYDKRDDYCEAVNDIVSGIWNIPVLRANRISNIHPTIDEYRVKMMRTSSDSSHLGPKGHEYFSYVVESFMLSL